MEVINGITHFFTMDDKYGMLITKTTDSGMIEKLSGLTGKKNKYWKRDGDGKKFPSVKNHKWTDDDGKIHGNDKEYIPLSKTIREIIAEPLEEELIEEVV